MEIDIHQSWKPYLQEEFEMSYFKSLINFVKDEYQNNVCYPPENLIFNAFNHCHFEDIKVVIIGQDPYHGPNQATGLCFAVNKGIKIPPSLRNIMKELKNDTDILKYAPKSSPKSETEEVTANKNYKLLKVSKSKFKIIIASRSDFLK